MRTNNHKSILLTTTRIYENTKNVKYIRRKKERLKRSYGLILGVSYKLSSINLWQIQLLHASHIQRITTKFYRIPFYHEPLTNTDRRERSGLGTPICRIGFRFPRDCSTYLCRWLDPPLAFASAPIQKSPNKSRRIGLIR